MTYNTMNMNGTTFVLVPQAEFARMTSKAAELPPMPDADEDGNYPALEAMVAVTARKIIEQRTTAGLTQKALAESAGIRAETLNKIEKGKATPDTATLIKIDRALKRATATSAGRKIGRKAS